MDTKKPIEQDPKAPLHAVKIRVQKSGGENPSWDEPHEITVHALSPDRAKEIVAGQNPGAKILEARLFDG